MEFYKKTNIEIPDDLLDLLLERYHNLSKYEQKRIINDYTEFGRNLNAT